ncbi:MAG: sensor histidine kinase [Alphaproteobacteria bacterium]|nr:sensor histidine kinase [Alphaproteobacteria bacterium]
MFRARSIQTQRRSSLLSRYATDLGEFVPRKRSERALKAAAMESALANRAKSEFLANMSHELRTPLNAIIGFSEIIVADRKSADNDKHGEYAEHIHRAGKHLLGIISDILDISKIESGTFTLDREPQPIGDLIESAIAMVKPRFDLKKQTFEAKVASELPVLAIDARRIKQVLINLLSNAHKFTPEGGYVLLLAAPERGGGLTVAVKDSGIGMTPEQIAIAMKPFGQIHTTYSRNFEGTGLGLPITKALIDQHGGRLVIASEPNHGTTVAFTLPRPAQFGAGVHR